MTALYKKSELWFAIGWIILYVVGAGTADNLSAILGIEKVLTLPLLLGMCALLLGWMRRQGLTAAYGLCKAKYPATRFLYWLPLVALTSCNLWFGVTMQMSVTETILYMGSMLCVGLLEELIFRGLLFRAMCRDSVTAAIIVSSLTFGIGHIVNLFNGSGAELLPTLCQIVYAAAAGFLFVILFYRGGSLWPCILTHSLLNALSAFAVELTAMQQMLSALLLTLIALGYGLILLKTLPKEKEISL